MAQRIGHAENADLLVVELAALLHDIADWKLHDGDSMLGPKMAKQWLDSLDVDPSIAEHVCQIIANISFKGAGVEQPPLSLEGQVVQDADRLDAMGAIGIARAFVLPQMKVESSRLRTSIEIRRRIFREKAPQELLGRGETLHLEEASGRGGACFRSV
jgi:HD superfamily phosphodiesterase